MIGVVYSNKFLQHNRDDHPENARRLISIMNTLRKSDIYRNIETAEPEPLDERILLDTHSKEMVNVVMEMSKKGGWIDMDTYVSRGSYDIARLAAGGVALLASKVLNGDFSDGFALVRPPGHHATRYRSMGFCLFNNIAISAHILSKMGKKVLIFDHDVHHGNGTQEIFYRDPDVMYQSFHLSPHYPGTGDIKEVGEGEGEGYTVNLPLPRGAGKETILEAMDTIFIPIADEFKPDIILISAGFDSHYQDMLGGLRLDSRSFYEIIHRFREIQKRIVCSLEGGYNLQKIGHMVVSEIEAMIDRSLSYIEDIKEVYHAKDRIEELKREMRKYWDV